MIFNVAMLKQMQAEGLDLDACIRVFEAGEEKRSSAAVRQARYRDNKRNERDVTRDVTNGSSSEVSPAPLPNSFSITPTPPKGVVPPKEKPLTKAEILEAWRDRMVPQGFPAVAKMTAQRERQLAARLRDSTLDEWMRVFAALERSAFCRGENERGWRANFDFLLQPKSFTKLLEGAYDH